MILYLVKKFLVTLPLVDFTDKGNKLEIFFEILKVNFTALQYLLLGVIHFLRLIFKEDGDLKL